MRFKTSHLQLEVLNPHKDQLLIFYILLKGQLILPDTNEMYIVFRYWLIKFLILIGLCVGAFFIPRGDFGIGMFVILGC